MDSSLVLLSLVLFYFIYHLITKNVFTNKSTPPGPFALPILGNLLALQGPSPHLKVLELTQKYGRVFRFWMGDQYSLFISDPDLVREVFVKNFENFSDRVPIPSYNMIGSGYRGLSSSGGSHWKSIKDILVKTFAKTSLKKAADITADETVKFIDTIKEFTKTGEPFTPRKYCQTYSMNIMLRFVFSKFLNYKDSPKDKELIEGLIKPMDKVFVHLGAGHLGDYVKIFQPLYFFFLQFADPSIQIKKYIEKEIKEHQDTFDKENIRDILDFLLSELDSLNGDLKTVRALAQDYLIAGSETASGTIEWFIMLMANYPETQEKAYSELINVVGKDCQYVPLEKRSATVHVNNVIKEVMRFHPIGPWGMPRSTNNEITLNSVHFPKGTQVFMHLHHMFKSEEFWDEPNEFKPERFLNSAYDSFIPFGLGSRNCIGQSLANDELYVSIANLLLNFKFERVGDELIDETELFGLTVHPNLFSVNVKSRK
ncbi:hypothetical protein CYY_001795 [Polysphondylium violaceum]|uniref:Cytochrome P450 family protein n=1 Tax=Polysphondylium violaceum TaxID=133409 RepID=A0A8J4V7J2_9MYCE|nr:hypothetical protein CYY_001795 [Polysphondylium violaceum]